MADNIIEQLSIEISSDVNKANEGIEKLKGTLNSLKSVYDDAGKGNADVRSDLKSLSDGVNNITGINSAKLNEATSAIKELSKIKLAGLVKDTGEFDSQGVDNLVKLANAFATFASAPDVSGAVKSVNRFAKADFAGLASNLSNLTPAMMWSIEDLSKAITSLSSIPNADYATKVVGRFANIPFDKLATNVSTITEGVIGKIKTFAAALGEFGKVDYFDGIAGAVKATQRIASIDFKAFSTNVGNIDENAAMKLKRLMDVFNQMSGDTNLSDTIVQMQSFFSRDYSGFLKFVSAASAGLPALADGLKQLSAVASTPEFISAIDKLASVSGMDFHGMVTASSALASNNTIVPDVSAEIDRETQETEESKKQFIDVLKSISIDIGKTFPKVTKIFKDTFKGIKNIGVSALDTVKKGFDGLGAAAKKAVKPITNFVNSIGRILKYRAIRFVLSSISKAIKEGTNNMYQYSKAVGGEFAKSMDTLATSALYFKNSIGAMLAPIINALTPAIDKAVDKLVEFNNVINETVAKLTGASIWTRAIKIPKEYAESANKATKDTVKGLKEAKDTLKDFQMGFDELNVISQDAFDNLSTPGLNDETKEQEGIDYTLMFEDVQVDIDPIWEAFRKAIEGSDFYEAGRLFGMKVKDMFGSLPYEDWAKTLATGINNAVAFATGFLETKPFDELGDGIARFINTAFENIDFYGIGRMIAAYANALSSGLNELVTKLDFTQIGQSFADGFNGLTAYIDFDTIFEDISNGFNGILDSVNAFLENANIKDFATNLGKGFSNFDFAATIGNIGTLIKNTLDGIADAANGLLTGVEWDKLGADLFKGLSDFIFGNDWGETGAKAVTVINNLTQAIGDFLGGFGGEIVLNIFDSEELDNWISGAETYTEWVNKAHDAVVGWAEYVNENGGIFQTYIDSWGQLGEKVYDFFHRTDEEAEKTKKTMEEYPSPLENIKNDFNTACEDIKTYLSNLGDKFKTKFDEIKKSIDGVNTKIADFSVQALKRFNSLKTNAIEKLSSLKSGIEEKFNEIALWIADWDGFKNFMDYLKGLPSKVGEEATNIKNAIAKPFDSIPDVLRTMANNAITVIEDLANGIISGFNGIGDSFKKTFSWADKILGNSKYKIEIPRMEDISLPRFAEGGFPNAGDLFFANESGIAEMVGSIGNRTAVANNDQIVDAVSAGVSEATSIVMAEYIPQIINAIMQNKTIEIDGKKITREINTINSTSGFSIYAGGVT